MIQKISLFLIAALFFSCRQQAKPVVSSEVPVIVPAFSADSAYHYIQGQVNFGPRVPNTNAHKACAEYLVASLQRFGAKVTEQKVKLTAFNGNTLDANNIIASFKPDEPQRILLFAHWDSRPWSDHDPDPRNHNKPVLGANDGASGVGVLLEIGRQIGLQSPHLGVDIIFFDAEDYGAPEDYRGNSTDSWCLGSQYWTKNPHVNAYRAKFGILLDMVGAKGAKFYREQVSDYYARNIVDRIWNTATNLGFDKYFINRSEGSITDDHLYVNQIAGIPSANIIQYDPQSEKGFGYYWHTVNDNMSNINKETLFAVGTTVMHVIYNEQ
ncbi:MAG: M28 family peptidase [Paludibacter sp.]|nr:M28 family peptidase [Paludibacter sp.]MDD4197979.1 M28 family peptidase [Paludibacter sp.]MDD4427612.1 M28 family peptidase [Paludibacter sp.]